MRTLAVGCLASSLLASVALGQTPPAPEALSRVFYFTHADTPQRMQEINNIVRAMSETSAVTDATRKSLTVQGSNTQLALAEWMVSEMDRSTPSGTLTTQTYLDQRGRVDVVRVFALAHATTPQQMQELTNVIRSISDLQRVFPYNSLHMLAVRGSAQQMAIAEWLIQQLDREPDTPAPDAGTRDMPWGLKGTHTAKVFYLTHGQSAQQAQAVLNQIKAATKIDHAYPYNAHHALALCGTTEQLTAAAALLKELDTK